MTPENAFAYDRVPYSSYVYAQTHPDRLATIATLLGMTPTPVETCRVLELGCGAGGNIIPLSFDLAKSSFVGIDLAATAISEGQEIIRRLDLKNVSLLQADLLTVKDLGEFDYIIAHGLYSWVPEIVRNRILSICSAHLAPNGIAYISYNTYPGCRFREIARDIMRFHTKDSNDPVEKVRQSRAVIKWLAESQLEKNSYNTILREMTDKLMRRDDGSIYHDDLADTNVPFYFHEFVTQAHAHGLQFLSEADFFEGSGDLGLSKEAKAQLDELGKHDVLAREQYLDFFKGRSFRQSLLCHSEVELSRQVDLSRLSTLLIKSQLRPTAEQPNLEAGVVEEFRSKKGSSVSTDQPLLKKAFLLLAQIYPRAIGLMDLAAEARQGIDSTDSTPERDWESLAEMSFRVFEIGGVELLTREPRYAVKPGEFPVASPIARLQLAHGTIVTTLLHDSVRFDDPLAIHLLALLDGTRDRSMLESEMAKVVEPISANSEPTELPSIATQLENKLNELGKLGLLVS